MAKEVVGIYTTLQETIDVVDRLTAQGYSTSNISIISNGNDGTLLKKQTGANVDHTTSGQDEQNSSVWEKIKGFFKPDYYDETTRKLTNLDLPQDELDRYSAEIDAGHYLVLVDNDASALNETAAPGTADPATEVSGQTTASGLKNEFGENYSTSQEKKVDVREEVLDVEKNPVQAGEVEVNKEVKTEEKDFDVPVQREEVYVEKRPVENGETNEAVDGSETVKVPIVEEQVEVTKKPVKTEEIVIGKRTVEDTEHISENVKKEEAHIKQNGENGTDLGK